jgi:K+-sensing histidine kinase KdpD
MVLALRKLGSGTFRVLIGVVLALAASLISAHIFAATNARTAVPLWFILVLYVLAWRYGFGAGVIGSLLCALVFAYFLFDPTGSWHVQDAAARKSLLWMVVGTTAISYLLTPPSFERKGS